MDKQPTLSYPTVHLVHRRAQRNIRHVHKSLLSIVKQIRVVSGETLKLRRKTVEASGRHSDGPVWSSN